MIELFLFGSISLSSIPLIMIFLDYHKKKNIHKAILYVLSFIGTILLISQITDYNLLYLSLLIPPCLFIYVWLCRS